MTRRKNKTAGVGARGFEGQRIVALHSKSTTARRRRKSRPRPLPPGLLRAREAVDGRLPPITQHDIRTHARLVARRRLQDEQWRRERGYPFC